MGPMTHTLVLTVTSAEKPCGGKVSLLSQGEARTTCAVMPDSPRKRPASSHRMERAR